MKQIKKILLKRRNEYINVLYKHTNAQTQTQTHTYVYIYIHIYTYILYTYTINIFIYIYIYIQILKNVINKFVIYYGKRVIFTISMHVLFMQIKQGVVQRWWYSTVEALKDFV